MKRFACMIFAILVMMTSLFAFGVAAEDSTNPDYIYFQVPTAPDVAWKNFTTVFCHIWEGGDEGGDFYAWQAKEERCEDLGNGYYSYNLSSFTFEEDAVYSVIFSNENGMQTYNLTLTSDCKGDIAVCEGDICENPVDSEKQCAVARWVENKDKVHPCAGENSVGLILDPDGIDGTDVDLTWGNSEGVSIAFPEIVVPTEAPTEAPTVGEVEEVDGESDGTVSPWLFVIIGGAVAVVAIVIVVVVIAKKKK